MIILIACTITGTTCLIAGWIIGNMMAESRYKKLAEQWQYDQIEKEYTDLYNEYEGTYGADHDFEFLTEVYGRPEKQITESETAHIVQLTPGGLS